MGYDDVIVQMGEFGRYQRRIWLLLCLPAISCGLHKMGGVFLAAEANFRCILPYESPENATYELPPIVANISYPWDYNTQSLSQCERYGFDSENQYRTFDKNSSLMAPILKCDSYVYDQSEYTLTATTEWNLVCDRAWLRATSYAMFNLGDMLGSIIFSALSDIYGRRAIFFLALMVQLIGGILVVISPEFISFMVFRLIIGSTTSGVFLIAYVLALEMVGPKNRLTAAMVCELLVTFGQILVAGLAYLIRNWRILEIAFTLPSLTFLVYWWFIPESARWLLSKGRVQEAKDMLREAASENGVTLSNDTLDGLSSSDSPSKLDVEESSVFDLVKYPNLRRKTLILCFVWLVNNGTYYGLSWNTSNLEGDHYLNYGLNISVEVPAYLFVLFTLDKWGRKTIVCACSLFAGISMLLTVFVPADLPWLVVALATLGKFALTASFGAIFVFTAEQYPTAIRNVGLGACCTSGRFGGILAPYINYLVVVWARLPLVIFGSSSLIAGLLSLVLPETLNTRLPESLQDVEKLEKKIDESENAKRISNDCNIVQTPTTGYSEVHM